MQLPPGMVVVRDQGVTCRSDSVRFNFSSMIKQFTRLELFIWSLHPGMFKY